MSGYLGFPPLGPPGSVPAYSVGPSSPFDIRGISEAIDQAVMSLRPEERGSLTVRIDESGAGAGLVIRLPQVGPFEPKALATVTKPRAGRFGWSLSGRVGFLFASTEPSVRIAPDLRGLYRLFRHRGSTPAAALVKAWAVSSGREVRLDV